jgi:hypothetical protein
VGVRDSDREARPTPVWPVLLVLPLVALCCGGPLLAGILNGWALAAWRWRLPGAALLGAMAVAAGAALAWRRAGQARCCGPAALRGQRPGRGGTCPSPVPPPGGQAQPAAEARRP